MNHLCQKDLVQQRGAFKRKMQFLFADSKMKNHFVAFSH